jgi:hypothetical protein
MANEHRKMTVARALKEKERILRRLAEAKTLFEGVNCVKVGEVRDADPEAVYGDVQSLQKRYLEIKKAIAVANAGISPKLAELLVAKTELNFYHRLSCRVCGTDQYDIFIDTKKRREIIEMLNTRIEDLQDEVDNYNVTHFVELGA